MKMYRKNFSKYVANKTAKAVPSPFGWAFAPVAA